MMNPVDFQQIVRALEGRIEFLKDMLAEKEGIISEQKRIISGYKLRVKKGGKNK